MKIKEKNTFIIVPITICLILGHISLRDAAAQTIKAADSADMGYFSLKADMKSYQIICKEYGKDYTDYYNFVRQKIVQKLKYNYRDYYRDGDVNLFFVLKSNGSLTRIDVDTGRSTADKKLIDIALASLQQASPFRPFPKELNAAELPFSLTISFKENN